MKPFLFLYRGWSTLYFYLVRPGICKIGRSPKHVAINSILEFTNSGISLDTGRVRRWPRHLLKWSTHTHRHTHTYETAAWRDGPMLVLMIMGQGDLHKDTARDSTTLHYRRVGVHRWFPMFQSGDKGEPSPSTVVGDDMVPSGVSLALVAIC